MLLTAALLSLLSVSSATKAPPSNKPATAVATGRVREVVLDASKRLVAPEIKLAPAMTATLTFPEPWVSAPACGDCQHGDAENKGQYWRIDVDAATNAISLKFIGQPTSAMLTDPPVTNINLQLESGLYVSLLITLTLDAKASDLRVDFRFPEGSGAKEKLSAKAKALEDNFAARVAEAADKAVLTTLMSPTRCRQFLGSPQRSNDLVVRIDQLCSNGRYVYVNFSVENAQRADISLLTAQLTSQSGATSVETRGDAEVPVVLFEKTALSFRETTRGVAAIPIVDPNVPPATYTLTVQEDGGGERVAVVEGIASSGGCSSTAAGSPVLLAALLKLWRRRRMGNR